MGYISVPCSRVQQQYPIRDLNL
uniref:Uncharacterized protein n=1 Tax=Anguilla anguilla TaxID=7936 RepID=A0A0E9QFF1_ANGAN